jgi:hypothetical protein
MADGDDFIWLLEDTTDFISGRIFAAIERYRDRILPPMFAALADFASLHEYSWHTPGHAGGTAFLKSPVGRAFFEFFGESLLRSDLSISVGELGSLLDHSGPIGESEGYAARVFGAHRSYTVTNGTSTSNRVVVMASVTRNQVALCDRNCHKSIEHSMTLSGAIPTYLMPSRNHYGIIGPILPERLTPEAVKRWIGENALVKGEVDPPRSTPSSPTRPMTASATTSRGWKNCSAPASNGCISTTPGMPMPGSTRSIVTALRCTAIRKTMARTSRQSSPRSRRTNCWRPCRRPPSSTCAMVGDRSSTGGSMRPS